MALLAGACLPPPSPSPTDPSSAAPSNASTEPTPVSTPALGPSPRVPIAGAFVEIGRQVGDVGLVVAGASAVFVASPGQPAGDTCGRSFVGLFDGQSLRWTEAPAALDSVALNPLGTADEIVATGRARDCTAISATSDDGGSTWAVTSQVPSFRPTRLFTDRGGGWFASGPRISWHSTDGVAWSPIDGSVQVLGFAEGQTLVAVAGGRIVTSSDRGASWTDVAGLPADATQFAIDGPTLVVGTEHGLARVNLRTIGAPPVSLASSRTIAVADGDGLIAAIRVGDAGYVLDVLSNDGGRLTQVVDLPSVEVGPATNGALAIAGGSLYLAIGNPAIAETVFSYRADLR